MAKMKSALLLLLSAASWSLQAPVEGVNPVSQSTTVSFRTENVVEKPSSAVIATPTIITNANVSSCNVEGLPGNITYYGIGQKHAKNPLVCEEACLSNNKCRSYSYQEVPETNPFLNCHLYSVEFDTKINATPLVMTSQVSGIFYSNRFFANDTNYCYLPAGSSSLQACDEAKSTWTVPQTKGLPGCAVRGRPGRISRYLTPSDIEVTPTTSSTPSATTTNPAIQTKALATCHQQGMPTTILLTFFISAHPSPSVLECQGSCKAEEKCLSYSYRDLSGTNTEYPTCELFSKKWDSQVNGTDLVIKSWRYGIYYSDRYPGDGSEECFVAVN